MRAHLLYPILLPLLAACNPTTTKEQRMTDFYARMPAMSCAELAQEIKFQQGIRQGLIERQQQEITAGDGVTTALTLGINVGINESNRSERDDRINELTEKIALISTKKSETCKE